MKEILDLIHELRCDINYCKVSGENDTEIQNANETLIKLQKLVKNLNISDVSRCKYCEHPLPEGQKEFCNDRCNREYQAANR